MSKAAVRVEMSISSTSQHSQTKKPTLRTHSDFHSMMSLKTSQKHNHKTHHYCILSPNFSSPWTPPPSSS